MPVTLVDGHAHFYPSFDLRAGLDAAAASFRSARRAMGLGTAGSDCLVVVDPVGIDGYDRLLGGAAEGWSMATAGPHGVRATRGGDGTTIVVLAGRQVRTEDGLEVLAFCAREGLEDGLPLEAAVEAVLLAGGRAVVPWGFGKWWGRRGRRVEELIRSSLGRRVLIADSSTRPRSMPAPRQFDLARELGVPVVAGTDPLPFPGEERKMARYGFVLEGELATDEPAKSLEAMLLEDSLSPRIYGARETTLGAIRLQVSMQLRRIRA